MFYGYIVSAIFILLLNPISSYASSASDVFNKVSSSVFKLITSGKESWQGTTVAVRDNLLVTNCHVLKNADYIKVNIRDNYVNPDKVFQSLDKGQDLCYLLFPPKTFTPVKLRPTFSVSIGEEVYAIGNPLSLDRSISRGIVSQLREVGNAFFVQTDTAVAHGSSGGGLFDREGKLIGITTLNSEGINLSLPSEWIKSFLDSYDQGKVAEISQIASNPEMPHSQPVANKQPDKPKICHISSFYKINNFGRDRISLYKVNDSCFIYILGRDDKKRVVNSAFLILRGNALVFLPSVISGRAAFALLLFEENMDSFSKLTSTESYVVINNRSLLLKAFQPSKGPVSFYTLGLGEEDGKLLNSMTKLSVHYDWGKNSSTTYYGLDGIEQAVEAYYKECR